MNRRRGLTMLLIVLSIIWAWLSYRMAFGQFEEAMKAYQDTASRQDIQRALNSYNLAPTFLYWLAGTIVLWLSFRFGVRLARRLRSNG